MTLRWLRRLARIRTLSQRWLGYNRQLQLKLQLERLEDRTVPTFIHWTGATNNLWTVATNWDTGVVPTSADDVFDSQSGQIQVTGAATAKTLDFAGGTAQLHISSGGSLTLGSASSDISTLTNGLLLDAGGTITATGTVNMGGASVFTGGTINGGTLSAGAVTGGLHVFSPGSVSQSSGQVTLNGNMAIEFGGAAGGQYNLSALVNPAITGSGTLVVRSGGHLGLSGSGTIGVSHLENDGAVAVASGTTFAPPANTDSGTWSVASGGTLSFGGTYTFSAGTSFSGGGNLSFSGSNTFNTNVSLSNINPSSATLTAGSGDVVTFSGTNTLSSMTLQGAGSFANTGSITDRLQTHIATTFSNSGTFTINGPTPSQLSLDTGGVFNNTGTGTFTVQQGDSPQLTGAGQLNNSGLIVFNSSGGGSLSVNNYNNLTGGEIRNLQGTLQLPASGTQAGTFTAAPEPRSASRMGR